MTKSQFQNLWKSYIVWDENNIKGFFGDSENEYKFLSNFHLAFVYYEGLRYPSTEHAYQAAKTKDKYKRSFFTCAPPITEENGVIIVHPIMSAGEAKKAGQKLKIRNDWDKVKYDIMLSVVFDKFFRHLDLRQRLINTGDKYLEELNHWSDFYWGVDFRTKEGKNMLGKVLMKVRECLR